MKKSLVCLTLLLSVSLSACGRSATPPQASPGVSPSPGAATGGGTGVSPSPGATTGGGTGVSPSPGATTGGGTGASPSPGATTGGGSASTGDVQAVFKQNCISCHGVNLEGGVGPNLQKVGTKYSKDQIVGIITNGRGAMPSFKGKLSDNEIGALSDWLSAKK